jgi:hypothetical protein
MIDKLQMWTLTVAAVIGILAGGIYLSKNLPATAMFHVANLG